MTCVVVVGSIPVLNVASSEKTLVLSKLALPLVGFAAVFPLALLIFGTVVPEAAFNVVIAGALVAVPVE